LNTAQSLTGPKMLDSLLEYGYCMNGSPTGAGKTVLTIWLKQQIREKYGVDVTLVVVGPASLEVNKTGKGPTSSPWTRESNTYNEDLIFITYDMLRGATPQNDSKVNFDIRGQDRKIPGIVPITECMDKSEKEFTWYSAEEYNDYSAPITYTKNASDTYTDFRGLVVRKDVLKMTEGGKKTYQHTFSPSKYWMEYCYRNVVFLVVDETHYAKNDSVQNNAVAALIRGISRARIMRQREGKESTSYFTCLTATPMDKELQASNYFKLIGSRDPVRDEDMFVKSGTRDTYLCFSEARIYDEKKAVSIALSNKIVEKRSKLGNYVNTGVQNLKASYLFWLECVLPKIQFVVISISVRQLWNGFLDVYDESDLKLLDDAHEELVQSKAYAEKGNSKESMKLLSNAHKKTDKAMVNSITRAAIKTLNTNDSNRVIIAFRLIESVDRSVKILRNQGFDVGRVAGPSNDESSAEKKRAHMENIKALNDFQQDKIQVIVGTLSMLSTGIDLHDTIGGRQRFTYMPGDYNITTEQQLGGRTARYGSQSVPQIFICYPKKFGPSILNVYNRNVEKSIVMAKILEAISTGDMPERDTKLYKSLIKLPGEYNRYIELPEGCEILSYVQDSPIYDRNNDRYIPAPDTFGYIGTNNEKGRLKYKDTAVLISYLERKCKKDYIPDEIPNIKFSFPAPHWLNPFPTIKPK
jgi:hypothetical protein